MPLRNQLARLATSATHGLAATQIALGLRPRASRSVVTALRQWADTLEARGVRQDGRDLLVFALRNRRWVEWAVFSACYLAYLGHRPAVAFSARELARVYGGSWLDWGLTRGFWVEAQRRLPFRFLDIDGTLPEGGTRSDVHDYAAFSERAAHVAAAYDLRVEEHDDTPEYASVVAEARRDLSRWAAAVEDLLRVSRFHRVICPSGLIGATSAVREAAARCGVDAVFVEGWALRPGHNIWSLNAPALQFDIPRWKAVVGRWGAEKEREFEAYLRFRQGESIPDSPWLRSFHQVQRSDKSRPLPQELDDFLSRAGPCLLMGPNVVGDSATLGRGTLFPNQRAWIEAVVDLVRARPDMRLVVRAHPDEAWKKSRLRMGTIAAEAAGSAANVFVVHGSDDVNTASLMDRADVGLPWVSNFGLEMAFRGKPVVLAAGAQYAYTGACHVPETRERYLSLLSHPEKLTPPGAESIREAKLYQYIVFKHISLEADSPDYLSFRYRIEGAGQPELARFYRILAGDLPVTGHVEQPA